MERWPDGCYAYWGYHLPFYWSPEQLSAACREIDKVFERLHRRAWPEDYD